MAGITGGFAVVSSAGTAVALATGSSPVYADWVNICPRIVGSTPNAGEVRISGKPPSGVAIPSGTGQYIQPGNNTGIVWSIRGLDLRTIYVDANVSGDGVQFIYATL